MRALYARPEHVGWLQVMGGDLKYPSGHFVMESPKMVNRQQPFIRHVVTGTNAILHPLLRCCVPH